MKSYVSHESPHLDPALRALRKRELKIEIAHAQSDLRSAKNISDRSAVSHRLSELERELKSLD